jgi:hypothetical protein
MPAEGMRLSFYDLDADAVCIPCLVPKLVSEVYQYPISEWTSEI